MDLANKIVTLHQVLSEAKLPHAFGGALALAWCTERARGTIDIDVNIMVPVTEFESVLAALPAQLTITKKSRTLLKNDGQVRLWWEKTPIDVFLNNTPFHESIGKRVRWEQFAGHSIPFLACQDIAVFKVFFNRTKDWADLEAMHAAGTLEISEVRAVLTEYLGADDERVLRLNTLV